MHTAIGIKQKIAILIRNGGRPFEAAHCRAFGMQGGIIVEVQRPMISKIPLIESIIANDLTFQSLAAAY
jgi:hypothetical protein